MESEKATFDPLVAEIRLARLPAPERRRRIRQSAGVSLRTAAQALDVAPMTVLRWERGDCIPSRRQSARYRELLEALEEVAREDD